MDGCVLVFKMPPGRGRRRLQRPPFRWALVVLLFCFLQQVSVRSHGFAAPASRFRQGRVVKAEPDEVEGRRTSRSSLYFLAVKDAIYTALFGAPEIHPETSWDGVGGTLANVTASAMHGAASGAKGALHSASSSLLGGAASGLKVLLHLPFSCLGLAGLKCVRGNRQLFRFAPFYRILDFSSAWVVAISG
eukprot:s1385_g1.t1